jgi:hypothetical protein
MRWIALLLLLVPGALAAQVTSASPHGRLRAAIDCADCHTAVDWTRTRQPMQFDHARQTGFPLTGSHATVECTGCHADARFDQPRAEPQQCASCHVDPHEGTLSIDCAECHTTGSFHDARAPELHLRTSFALEGAHAVIECERCHTNGLSSAIETIATQCVDCHEADRTRARFPDHLDPAFPQECVECHPPTTWAAGRFDHASLSGFALAGAHERITCESCHIPPGNEPRFDALDENDCIACHRAEFEAEHPTGFPETCLECHDVNSWQGADFDHGAITSFALLGAHDRLDCEDCHIPPANELRWQPADVNDCVACHQADYDRAHPGSFGTICADCHNVNTWEDATVDHDPLFPIYSGEHRGKWDGCRDCHTTGSYTEFTCATCHSRGEMDDEHDDEDGYAFEPQLCLSCHPRGDKEDD